ncbi:hypothetical protein [Marinobacter salexigens]|uniref:hypothetical protein n=1 Tax=Marinobacter salexigens TaxID=1925763 RepID=UPI001961C500|nr:hypothetical protein [Marinobacter salexigens]
MSIGQDLLNVPMGEMIRDMAFAIADSQFQLDQSGMRTAEMMGGLQSVFDDEGNQTFDDSRIFFGYEYMSVRAALAYAIFDDSLTGALDADSVKLTEVVLNLVSELGQLSATQSKDLASNGESAIASAQVDGKPLLDEIIRVPTRLSMMELGFTPTFYQFVDTIIEVKIAIKMTRSYESTRTRTEASRDRSSSSKRSKRGGGLMGLFGGKRSRSYAGKSSVQTTQVDATYSSKYSYSAEGASLLRTKLVPVPPPAILEERIRGFVDIEEETRRARLTEILDTDDNT